MGINLSQIVLSGSTTGRVSTGERYMPNPRARATDPSTSHAAAEANAEGRQTEALILLRLFGMLADSGLSLGGATAREAGRWVKLPDSWRRVSELHRDGLIAPLLDEDGEQVLRALNGRGQRGRVMAITPAGRAVLAGSEADA